ncbi:MAG TPA: M48 family metallopeptidase [Solimonas sp.]|nr:M48 family metallopeptidase [Solimonas sp.]
MIEAIYYDGRTARRSPVQLLFGGGEVRVHGEGLERREPLAQVHISEKLGAAPRKLSFADGAFCEVRDHAAFEEALRTSGIAEGRVDLLQRSWHVAVVSLAIALAAAVAGYIWGLPALAGVVARSIPPEITRYLSGQTLEFLDGHWLQPSKMALAQRHQLGRAFARLQRPDGGGTHYQLLFRTSPQIGANAFALPDGSIVLLDELVELADESEIMGVLAHELGHVEHRHGLRMLVQGTIVGAFAAWWIGDTSTLLAAVPAALAQAHYSRGFETQADQYAVAMLRANGISPARLADLLEKLLSAHHVATGKDGEGWSDYLQSHPAPAERIRALRGERAEKTPE